MRNVLAFCALALSAMIFLACNSTENRDRSSAPAATAPPTIAADGIRRVTVAELRDLLARNEAVVIDVRSEETYKAGHIHGAKLIPQGDIVKRANELPKDKLIVTYCS